MKKIIGIIPARGGSKGLFRKNIIDINGKPLISYTIEASLKSKYIIKTVVSSEEEEILDISKKYGASVIKRPKEFATDFSNSECVIKDTLIQLKNKGEIFDILVLLQPTSPLRNEIILDKAIEKLLISKSADSLISVCSLGCSPCKSFVINKYGFLVGLVNNKSPFMRRQDLPEVFLPNGAIYIIYVDKFLENMELITKKTIHYIMSFEGSFQLDNQNDFEKIELLLKEK